MSRDGALASELQRSGTLNCAQAMLAVYGKYFGLPEAMALNLAVGFGGGMGLMGNTCGAVTGAFMVLGGLTYQADSPNARNEVYALIREFVHKFIDRNGSICCRDLLGYDISTDEGMDIIREKKLNSIFCPGLVLSAAEIVEELAAGKLPHLTDGVPNDHET